MRIAVVLLLTLPALAADVPSIAEVRSILREASSLIPEIDEVQRGSLACNISGPQTRAGDLDGGLATVQLVPKGWNRDVALSCVATVLTMQGNWRGAIENIRKFADGNSSPIPYLTMAPQLARQGDYQDAITVARMILKTGQPARFADTMAQIYGLQLKAGDPGAARTLQEALDEIETLEIHPDTPHSVLAGRYRNLVMAATAGGPEATSPIVERLYELAAGEKDPAQKQEMLGHLVLAQAQARDFPAARRSAGQIDAGPTRVQALIRIAIEQATHGDPAGARILGSEIPEESWNAPTLQEFGLALADGGDDLGALSTIEKIEPDGLPDALGFLAIEEGNEHRDWALVVAQLALEAFQVAHPQTTFALQAVLVTRSMTGDLNGAMQILDRLPSRDRQWPLWDLTANLVEAGRKDEAIALAQAQEDPFPRAYALLGIGAEMLEQVENAQKKSAVR